jgi:hypothetical protein
MLFPDDHVLNHVDAYLHEALSPDEAVYVERHCEDCRICQVALEEARKRFAAMQTLPAIEASQRLIRAAQRQIAVAPRLSPSPALIGGMAAAAMVLVLAGVTLYYATLSPSPYDLRVLGQSEWLSGSEASLRVLLVDRRLGTPLTDVPVHIELVGDRPEDAITLARFTTDQYGSGAPRLKLPAWDEGEYELVVSVELENGEVLTRSRSFRVAEGGV